MVDASLKVKLPRCIEEQECTCFSNHFQSISICSAMDADYGVHVANRRSDIDITLHMIRRHELKDELLNTKSAIDALTIRIAVTSAKTLLKMFQYRTHGKPTFKISYPARIVESKMYLMTVEKMLEGIDAGLACFSTPQTREPLYIYKNIIHIFTELTCIFEKYLQLEKFGYTFPIIAHYGITNLYHIYY